MGEHHAVEVDPKELERAVKGWQGFTKLLKYSVIAAVAILALLGLVFVDWTS